MPAFPLIPVLAGASIFGSGALLGGKASQNKNRMAGNNPNLIVDSQGFIRTVPGAFQGPSGGTNLNLDLTGGAVPPVSITPGVAMLMPGSA